MTWSGGTPRKGSFPQVHAWRLPGAVQEPVQVVTQPAQQDDLLVLRTEQFLHQRLGDRPGNGTALLAIWPTTLLATVLRSIAQLPPQPRRRRYCTDSIHRLPPFGGPERGSLCVPR